MSSPTTSSPPSLEEQPRNVQRELMVRMSRTSVSQVARELRINRGTLLSFVCGTCHEATASHVERLYADFIAANGEQGEAAK